MKPILMPCRHTIRPLHSALLALFVLSGCGNKKDDPNPSDCNLAGIDINIAEIQAASACDRNDGSFTVSAQGANGAFLYSINGDDFQESGNFTGLPAGYYTVTVRDENQCQNTTPVSIGVEGSDLLIATIDASDAGCERSNGEITVTATGEGTLMYGLNGGTFQPSNVFTGLAAGSYQIVVKDESNCEITAEKRILNGTSYQQQVRNILETNCAVSGCHNGDNGASLNWTIFSNVQEHAGNIKSLTQSGSMPPVGSGQSLTEEEKDLIACWVDDGALNN